MANTAVTNIDPLAEALKIGDRVEVVVEFGRAPDTAILRQHAIGMLWYVEFDDSSPYQFLRRVKRKVHNART